MVPPKQLRQHNIEKHTNRACHHASSCDVHRNLIGLFDRWPTHLGGCDLVQCDGVIADALDQAAVHERGRPQLP